MHTVSRLEFPMVVQKTVMPRLALFSTCILPFRAGSVCQQVMGVFNFGLMHFLITVAGLVVH